MERLPGSQTGDLAPYPSLFRRTPVAIMLNKKVFYKWPSNLPIKTYVPSLLPSAPASPLLHLDRSPFQIPHQLLPFPRQPNPLHKLLRCSKVCPNSKQFQSLVILFRYTPLLRCRAAVGTRNIINLSVSRACQHDRAKFHLHHQRITIGWLSLQAQPYSLSARLPQRFALTTAAPTHVVVVCENVLWGHHPGNVKNTD